MTLADELGGPLIGATNEKPRLREQPGFSSVNPPGNHPTKFNIPTAAAAMMLKAETAYGDDADSLSHTGLGSDFYAST